MAFSAGVAGASSPARPTGTAVLPMPSRRMDTNCSPSRRSMPLSSMIFSEVQAISASANSNAKLKVEN